MAGRGSRFAKEGFDFPKPLIKIYDKPFFYWSANSIKKFIDLVSMHFVVLREHVEKYNIHKEIEAYFPEAEIHILPKVTEGAVITCLKGIESIMEEGALLFNDCDHLFKSTSFNAFCRQESHHDIKGILLSFFSDEPKYSYLEKNNEGHVIRTVEKEVISNEAICGCYYFASKEIFKDAVEQYLKECNYNEYFMSGVYNVMIRNNDKILSMPTDFHVSFGVPEEYQEAQQSLFYKELL